MSTFIDNTLEMQLQESIRQALVAKGAMKMQANGTSYGAATTTATAPTAAVSQPSPSITINTANGTAPDVYRAICQVAKALSRDGISKGRRNEQQGFAFRGIDDVMNALSALLAGAELLILPRMSSRTQEERPTAKGGVLFYVTVRAEFDFVSVRDGSLHTVTMYGEAMDSADKATNKAMSAAYKYACLQVFCIPTEGMADDADLTTPTQAPRPTSAPAPIPAGVPPVRELKVVPDSQTRDDQRWATPADRRKDFIALRQKLGSLVYEEELERYSLTGSEVANGKFKSGQHAIDAFEALIAAARRQLGVQ